MKQGADEYLTKPFDKKILLETIARLVWKSVVIGSRQWQLAAVLTVAVKKLI
jgi:FixJ family two-component response regulator